MKNDLRLHIIPNGLLDEYAEQFDTNVQSNFEALQDSYLSVDTFSFYTSVSAVFSSKIEGVDIELDSYIKHKRLGAHFQPDYTRKTDDLYAAYQYAQQHELNEAHILQAHTLITAHILQKPQQGTVRTGNMFVLTDDGRIEYVAATPDVAVKDMKLFYADLKTLCNVVLSFKEVFFYASLIHLVFVKIHPFEDGNGRTARLLEKWFIAHHLGAKAWFLQSEKHYYTHHQAYYNNIRLLGLEYDTLDYTKSLPFLLMLTKSAR